jgi:glycosyltransferase involved in cell wall biosynthesis
MKRPVPQFKSAIVVEHEANNVGPGHVLEHYFRNHAESDIWYIGHPNLYISSGYGKSSRLVKWTGKSQTQITASFFRLPEPLLYLKDFFYTLKWGLSHSGRFDIFVGLGNINAAAGIILRLFGKTQKTVYYVIDYVSERFKNPVLNFLYHAADYFAARFSDATWNLSPRMIEGRQKRWKIIFPHQLVVPHGLSYSPKKAIAYEKSNKHEIIYMGHLNIEQGIDFVISCMPEIVKKIPDASFSVIGTGNDEARLRQLVRESQLESHVNFLGLVRDNEKMEKRLAKAAVAIAMYKPDHAFSYYSDPGKIKHYLSVGLPVIMTGTPIISEKIGENNCGRIISYHRPEFIEAVIALLCNAKVAQIYRRNALRLAKEYDWDRLFAAALHSLFP